MSQVLNKVRDVDPNNSDAVKDALSGFFQNLPKYTETNCHQWLTALEDIINRFPKYCMTHRSTIETHLKQFLDSSNLYLVIEAAKCAHTLQQVRPSQEKTATPKTSWHEQTTLLCNAAHILIAALFPNVAAVYNNSDQNDDPSISTTPLSVALLHITEISKTNDRTKDYDVQDRHNLLCLRLRNVLVFLQAMLVEVYPVAKPIRPQIILDMLVRLLTASASAGLTTSEDIATLKTEALRTLDALVLCLGPNLIPFSPLVFRLAMQALRWSSDKPTEESRKVRLQSYSTLSLWLGALRCHKPAGVGGAPGAGRDGRGRGFEDELKDSLLQDITPPRHLVQLTMSNQPTKNLSKKAKRKMATTMLQESAIANHMPGEKNKITGAVKLNEDVMLAALDCLEMFLTVCGIFLKPTTHKVIQERILRECYAPGCSPTRLLRLLHCVEAARRGAGRSPTPTPRAMQLYSVHINSADPEISKFCSQALLSLRLQLHAAPPTISYSLDAPKETEIAAEERKKVVSERNRAALEQLLGAEKLPPSASEDVITILDEPTNKKARLSQDAETENISISSQSSVEISDDEEDIEIQEVQANEIIDAEELENVVQVVIEDPERDAEVTAELNKDDAPIESAPKTIHELSTQVHANISNDTTDGHEFTSPHSLEVDYDYPNTGKSKVTVLEKLEDDNLPSTNETDDIHITCGQVIKCSQDAVEQKKMEEAEEPKVNGIETTLEVNGFESAENVTETVTVKIATADGVTVEDMLADFVDEVNEEGVEV